MQYSASQYRRVQHQFLQQFELKTLQFYEQNVNSNNLIEYKKILNDLTTRRRQTISKKQNYKWRRKRETSYDNISQQKRTVYLPQNKQSVQEDNEAEVGFYITQNFCLKSRTKEIVSKQSNLNDYKQSRVDSVFTKSKIDPVNNMNSDQSNNNLDMDQLKDRIYGQYSVSQCLKHQQSQVQEAIFCFKKRIMALQQNLNTQDIKSKQVDRLLVQNNNQMLRAKHTNQQVRSAFLKTKKHFQLDLQGRRQIQQKFNEKNKEEFEQSIINHIYIKNMKQHIVQQQAKLHKLDTIRHELEKKEKKYRSIYTKEQELYKVYDQILKIDPQQIVKRPIVSILDKEFQQFEKAKTLNMSRQKLRECGKLFSRTKTHFKNNSIAEASKKKLSTVVKEIIELYRQMKHQQASRISEFKLLINQRDQKQSQYNKTLLKLAEINRTLFQQLPLINPQSKLLFQTLQQQISLISARTNSINNSSNGLEYRLKFYLSKQLTIMKKVIQNWLKSDKIAGKWIQAVLEKFSRAGVFIGSNSRGSCRAPYQQQIQERQLSSDDSRNLLISCFENWQEYLPFLDILHESSFIYRFMSKNKLFKLFKRIIKTKIANRQIPTQDIFQKALQNTFQQGRCLHISRIKNLLNVFKDLYIYLNKILSSQLPLQCSFNYLVPIQTQQPESNELSKLPSRNELQRISTKNTNPDRNSMGTKNEGNPGQKVQFNSLLTESKKINFVSSSGGPKMKDQDIISKLKKRKHLKSILNIHQFYQDLRQEIQKVNKISAF